MRSSYARTSDANFYAMVNQCLSVVDFVESSEIFYHASQAGGFAVVFAQLGVICERCQCHYDEAEASVTGDSVVFDVEPSLVS